MRAALQWVRRYERALTIVADTMYSQVSQSALWLLELALLQTPTDLVCFVWLRQFRSGSWQCARTQPAQGTLGTMGTGPRHTLSSLGVLGKLSVAHAQERAFHSVVTRLG